MSFIMIEGGGVGLFQMDRLIFIPPFVEFIYWNTELGVETGLAPVCYDDCSNWKDYLVLK